MLWVSVGGGGEGGREGGTREAKYNLAHIRHVGTIRNSSCANHTMLPYTVRLHIDIVSTSSTVHMQCSVLPRHILRHIEVHATLSVHFIRGGCGKVLI